MNISRPVIIFSVCQGKASDGDALSDAASKLRSLGVPFKNVSGSYKGASEHSFVVSAENLEIVKQLCEDNSQESYLLVDANRGAHLNYLSGAVHYLGRFKGISKRDAKTREAWTQDLDTNQYYGVN